VKKFCEQSLKWLVWCLIISTIFMFAFNQGIKAYNWLYNRENTLSFYNEKINVTCLQTMDPSLPAIFCLPGDRTKE